MLSMGVRGVSGHGVVNDTTWRAIITMIITKVAHNLAPQHLSHGFA